MIFSLDLGDFYDVLVINVVLVFIQLGGLLFFGFIGGVWVVFIDGIWVGFFIVDQIECVVFDMVVVGWIVEGDVVIMMVEVEVIENVVEFVEGGV